MISRKIILSIVSLVIIFTLAACSGKQETAPKGDSGSNVMEGHAGMNHTGSSDVPEGLKESINPTYPVGSSTIIHADHMPGMDGAEATISGAFDTIVYTITYTPLNGGEKVENHKWVIHEEIENATEQPYQPGDEVVLIAEHMEGMDGVTAIIDSAEQTTVYMVDYQDTETGEDVTYHKWVTESELSPVE
ncbi:YdhK family protein [Niallia sp. JL1B1071]